MVIIETSIFTRQVQNIYPKSEQVDLSEAQLQVLKKIIEADYR